MTLSTSSIVDAVVSHAMGLGVFSQVNAHEPKNAPSNGLACAIWADRIGTVRSSGLNSASARLALSIRIFTPMASQPEDAIDTAVLDAVDALFTAYCGDFTLDGLVRQVDILGASGAPLEAVLGYVLVDGVEYRVATIALPLIINDAWTEVA